MLHGKVYTATKEFTLLGQVLECATTHQVNEHDLILVTEQGHSAYIREMAMGMEPDRKMETMLVDMGPKFLRSHIDNGELVYIDLGRWDPDTCVIHV